VVLKVTRGARVKCIWREKPNTKEDRKKGVSLGLAKVATERRKKMEKQGKLLQNEGLVGKRRNKPAHHPGLEKTQGILHLRRPKKTQREKQGKRGGKPEGGQKT